MPRGRGRRRRQDKLRSGASGLGGLPGSTTATTSCEKVGRRPPADVQQEAYIERRQRVDEPE
ncbi:Hypothetical predicted protein [Mytilus galloprovincialis]|uniref:Uncharacterized protein n=1 Tax=Mytilus galloprovincialis TaxID=29158 RepID=A0A8B6FY50_MYTGA|nr:Hypothetical predicted protein [Mytilus galloprovincialis]